MDLSRLDQKIEKIDMVLNECKQRGPIRRVHLDIHPDIQAAAVRVHSSLRPAFSSNFSSHSPLFFIPDNANSY